MKRLVLFCLVFGVGQLLKINGGEITIIDASAAGFVKCADNGVLEQALHLHKASHVPQVH